MRVGADILARSPGRGRRPAPHHAEIGVSVAIGRRIGIAVGLALPGIGRDRDRARRHGKVRADIVDRVIAVGERALRDAVAVDTRCGRRCCCQRSSEAVAIDEIARGQLIGQCRIGVAIDAALGIGRHRDGALRHRQIAANIGDCIVAVGERALRDAVTADTGCHRRCCGQRAGQGVAIDQVARRQLVGQRRIAVAIGTALGIGRHRDGALRHRQVGADIADRIVAVGRACPG